MKLTAVLAVSIATAGLAQTPMPIIPPTGHVHTSGAELAYWVYGKPNANTTPVFAVNGGPGLSHMYMVQNDTWLRVSAQRQVIFYDQRGEGASPLNNASASQSIGAQVADLDAIREHLHFAKIDLCGDSFGGFLVIAYAAAHPEHVHKLIISDGLPSRKALVHLLPDVYPDKMEATAAAERSVHLNPEDAAKRGLLDHFRMLFYDQANLDHYLANVHDISFSAATGNAVDKATADIDLAPALPKFNFPVLVITGRFDMNVAPLTAWRMYKAIPGAKFEVFEKSGHLPYYEEPDKYVSVVDAFLGND